MRAVPPSGDEAEWMRRVADGDRGDPFVALYRRYETRVHAMGLRMLGDAGLAEEMTQETFVRLWRAAPTYDPGRGNVAAFVFTIARSVAVSLWRRPSSRPHAPEAEAALTDDGAFDRLVSGLTVRDAMGRLSPEHREVLELCYDRDLTQRQAAEALGVPLGTVKSRSYHALAALRGALGEGHRDA